MAYGLEFAPKNIFVAYTWESTRGRSAQTSSGGGGGRGDGNIFEKAVLLLLRPNFISFQNSASKQDAHQI